MRRGHRASALGAVLLAVTVGYVALVPSINEEAAMSERHLGAPSVAGGVQQLGVYADIASIDPVNAGMHLRIHLTPNRALRGERPGTSGRDLTVRIGDGFFVQELAFRANEPMPPTTVEVSLDGGRTAFYPLERFRATLQIAAQDGFHPSDDPSRLVPVSLTLWEGIPGWTVHTVAEPGSDTGEVRLQLDIWRTPALAFLALALYGMMVLIAGAALTIGVLIFLRARKLEATLASFLSGMLFALPVMRYALPGSPPLGVRADLLVFLWAELAVALGLLLFIVTWATAGPRE